MCLNVCMYVLSLLRMYAIGNVHCCYYSINFIKKQHKHIRNENSKTVTETNETIKLLPLQLQISVNSNERRSSESCIADT